MYVGQECLEKFDFEAEKMNLKRQLVASSLCAHHPQNSQSQMTGNSDGSACF